MWEKNTNCTLFDSEKVYDKVNSLTHGILCANMDWKFGCSVLEEQHMTEVAHMRTECLANGLNWAVSKRCVLFLHCLM